MPGNYNETFLDFSQAYRKAADYCAIQDRCISEIQLKLKLWSIDADFTNGIIDKLITEDFLNEKRFALNYAGGKFRIKGWGRIKIAAGLRARSVPPEMIQYALSAIGNEEYSSFLANLLKKKLKQLGGNTLLNRQKASFFAASRGFEPGLIASRLKSDDVTDY
jgi:regulatory protein